MLQEVSRNACMEKGSWTKIPKFGDAKSAELCQQCALLSLSSHGNHISY